MYKIMILLLLCSSCTTAHKYEYHIIINADSAYIYDNNDLLIGSCAHGNDGIDSVICVDNL